MNPAVVFEFDLDTVPSVGSGHVAVTLGVLPATDSAVADAIVSAVAGPHPTLGITAVKMAAQPYVTLTSSPGLAGNQAITETVADPAFTVAGMSGGAGKDCATGAGCGSVADCKGTTCSGAPKLCGP